MNIRLISLGIQNFKGIKSRFIDFDGNDAVISGFNEAGKTTVEDAFLYCITGKDSLGKVDAKAFKPMTSDGEEIHFLETIVECVLDIDGVRHTFKKMLKENWIKKRGQEEQEFSGNTVSCWIDEVPHSITEYKKYIDSIIPEETFKLITNSMYFMTLPWKDRREILFKMAGAKSDVELMKENEQFKGLLEYLNGRMVDDMKKIVKDRVKDLDKQIDAIPGRIDENVRALPDDKTDYSALEKQAADIQADINTIDEELQSVQKRLDVYEEKQKKIMNLRQQREKCIGDQMESDLKERNRAKEARNDILREINHYEKSVIMSDNLISGFENNIEALDKELAALRDEWAKINESEPVELPEDAFICPTCGQALPEDQKENMIMEARAKFETEKAEALTSITENGKRKAAEKQKYQRMLDDEQVKLDETNAKIVALKAKLPAFDAVIDAPETDTDYSEDPFVKSLAAQIEELEKEISMPQEDKSAALLEKKKALNEELASVNKTLAGRQIAEDIKDRIYQLKAEEKRLCQQKAKEEKVLFLIEKFTSYKCKTLEGNVNGMFDRVRWRLFERQINGGINECCDCLIKGISYDVSLNTGAKINAGVEIANVISKHHGYFAPMFIDNAEAVTKVYPTEGQQIRLYHVETQETLKIEIIKTAERKTA
jgi:exonuclease SbcC